MSARSVQIGGSVTGSNVVTGDHNTVTTTSIPRAEVVDILTALEAIRAALARLETGHKTGIDSAMAEAANEAAKDRPDKQKVGKALERAIDYAHKANGFAEEVDKLAPHVRAACAWLGNNWHQLIGLVT
jgi:hypothetical protein